ncbi:helix-turn-helix domain-containing protein [Enterobacter mori]|uniref:Helix-turn-helix domain-containing protein n=1 Tax=Enterobacter mori TaxID=539813 RepID=A0A7T0E041_9ENTR|nr:helix-turn-helix domain-containing protein [Enterobacter mori]
MHNHPGAPECRPVAHFLTVGLVSSTLAHALWPKGEKMIVNAPGMTPKEDWSSRYRDVK